MSTAADEVTVAVIDDHGVIHSGISAWCATADPPIGLSGSYFDAESFLAAAPSDAVVLFDGKDLSKWNAASFGRGGAAAATEPQWKIADGHAEIKRWVDVRTTPPLSPNVLIPLNVASPNNLDVAWLQDRSSSHK